MERFTRAISIAIDLLAAVERLGRRGRVPTSVGSSAQAARSVEGDQLGRVDRGRDVFPGKKRGAEVGNTKKGKGTKIMLLVDGEGTPLGAEIASASEAECHLIEPLIGNRTCRRRPQRLLYDKAADSDPLRQRLAARNIELICPHRKSRKRAATQDGRKLRRYKRRYKVERTISWLFNYRRIIVRYDYWDHIFTGFVQLGCLFTILKRF
jgi:transposase